MNLDDIAFLNEKKKSFWQEISHPCIWLTDADLPRLKRNATLPFWKPKFDSWRQELKAMAAIEIKTTVIDFHKGINKEALKAAMCWLVDEDQHYAQLIAGYLTQVVQVYRNAPDWREIMGTPGHGYGTGTHWGGLTNNHIVDPQMWISTAHLYDVIYDRGFMEPQDAADFEEMMSLFYRLSCLHEELHKMDNNRSVWLCAGGYISSLFDKNRRMADPTRIRLRNQMPRFLETILEDGWHYEIGGYARGTMAAMQVFARCIRGVEKIDYYKEKVDGVGMEDFYRSFIYSLIPAAKMRNYNYRDRISHWDSICAGYLEYDIPELGWLISRIDEQTSIPMFRHWPQGFEFYTYKEPDTASPPSVCNSIFPAAGITILRSSWADDASSLNLRYGFQGSSHGGGLDKLNVEITHYGETLIADPLISERSFDKNVILVDGNCQEQCSGKVLYKNLDDNAPIQYISTIGGFGKWPNRPFLNDPRAEINYWSTKHEECFPGVARMRRTVVQIAAGIYAVRDTIWSLDKAEHHYECLWHTFYQPQLTGTGKKKKRTYQPKKIFYSEPVPPETVTGIEYEYSNNNLKFLGDKASFAMHYSLYGAAKPGKLFHSQAESRYTYIGTPETGDRFNTTQINRLHIDLKGTDVAMTTLFITGKGKEVPRSVQVIAMEELSLDKARLHLKINGKDKIITADEDKGIWD